MTSGVQQWNETKLLPEMGEETAFLRSSITVHYIDCDDDGTILLCSPAVAKPLHLSAETLAGTSIWDLMPDSDSAHLKRRLEESEETRFRLNFWNAERGTFPLQCIAY